MSYKDYIGKMFAYNATISTTYYIVEHSPTCFAVWSRVLKRNVVGDLREFDNFVAEASSKEEAYKIAKTLQQTSTEEEERKDD